MNVVMLHAGRRRRGHASSRCRAPPRGWRSPVANSTRCSALAEGGLAEITDLQRETGRATAAARRR